MKSSPSDDENTYQDTFEERKADNIAKGFTVVESEPNLLLLDLDDGTSHDRFDKMLPKLHSLFGAVVEDRWWSKSGQPHEHVLVRLGGAVNGPTSFSAAERTTLQSVLGSDPFRDALTIFQIKKGVDGVIILFKPPTAPPPPPQETHSDEDDLPF